MRLQTVGAAILVAALAGSAAAASPIPSTTATTTYHRTEVDGVGIFYREAGPRTRPTSSCCTGSRRLRGSSTR